MENSMRFRYGQSGVNRDITIYAGSKYKVEPINKLKNRKNRDRVCTALGFRKYSTPFEKDVTIRVRVKWHDNERFGYVDPTDLVPI